MKITTIIFALITFVFQISDAQVEVFGSVGNVNKTTHSDLLTTNTTSISRLVPDIEGKALQTENETTYADNTEAFSGLFLELGVGNTSKINARWSYRLALSVSMGQYNQSQQWSFVDSETISSDTINHVFSTGGGFSPITCDTSIFRNGTSSFELPADRISIVNLNISGGLQYNITKTLVIGSELFARTPINSRRVYFNTSFDTEELTNGETACIYDQVEDAEHPISNLSELRFGISPFFSVQLIENLNIRIGANFLLTNTYSDQKQNGFFFFNQSPSHKAVETYLQVAYVFGSTEAADPENLID